jgi:hypothetical protein
MKRKPKQFGQLLVYAILDLSSKKGSREIRFKGESLGILFLQSQSESRICSTRTVGCC